MVVIIGGFDKLIKTAGVTFKPCYSKIITTISNRPAASPLLTLRSRSAYLHPCLPFVRATFISPLDVTPQELVGSHRKRVLEYLYFEISTLRSQGNARNLQTHFIGA
jgi:hypothetical protein